MSYTPALPPFVPEKTASGIVVDPLTLERVVPASRRADGSVRKEQRVRAGFVPQEDVGAYRPRHAGGARRVPGAGGRTATPGKAENPLDADVVAALGADSPRTAAARGEAQRPRQTGAGRAGGAATSKTGVQVVTDVTGVEGQKAARRTQGAKEAKETEGKARNWDSESEEDEGGAAEAARAFAAADARRAAVDDEAFPPLGKAETPTPAPDKSVVAGSTGPSTTARDATPATSAADVPGTTGAPLAAPSTIHGGAGPSTRGPSRARGGSAAPAWRRGPSQSHVETSALRLPPAPSSSAAAATARPHPIQGGRRGPIGLAHPPPPAEKRAERAQRVQAPVREWDVGKPGPQERDAGQRRGGGQRARPRGQGETAGARAADRNEARQDDRKEGGKKEERVRPPVRVRQGGATDVGSLASRVRNLVLDTQDGPKKRDESPAPE
ncbi:hypothetical protein Q5752_001044 [Cryptotrichosporon argae]